MLASKGFLWVRRKRPGFGRRWLSMSPFDGFLLKNFVCQDEDATQKDLTQALPPAGRVTAPDRGSIMVPRSKSELDFRRDQRTHSSAPERKSQSLFT